MNTLQQKSGDGKPLVIDGVPEEDWAVAYLVAARLSGFAANGSPEYRAVLAELLAKAGG